MNASGQVFGAVIVANTDYRPVLWTDGVGTTLPLPTGYSWNLQTSGVHFVNDSGTVVSMLRIADGVPGFVPDESRIVVWQNGMPQVLQPPDSCGYTSQHQFPNHQNMFPTGFNNQGHILFTTAGDDCGKLWLWDGSAYHPLLDIADHVRLQFAAAAFASQRRWPHSDRSRARRIPMRLGTPSRDF